MNKPLLFRNPKTEQYHLSVNDGRCVKCSQILSDGDRALYLIDEVGDCEEHMILCVDCPMPKLLGNTRQVRRVVVSAEVFADWIPLVMRRVEYCKPRLSCFDLGAINKRYGHDSGELDGYVSVAGAVIGTDLLERSEEEYIRYLINHKR